MFWGKTTYARFSSTMGCLFDLQTLVEKRSDKKYEVTLDNCDPQNIHIYKDQIRTVAWDKQIVTIGHDIYELNPKRVAEYAALCRFEDDRQGMEVLIDGRFDTGNLGLRVREAKYYPNRDQWGISDEYFKIVKFTTTDVVLVTSGQYELAITDVPYNDSPYSFEGTLIDRSLSSIQPRDMECWYKSDESLLDAQGGFAPAPQPLPLPLNDFSDPTPPVTPVPRQFRNFISK